MVAAGALILGSLGFYFTARAVTAGFQSKLVAIAEVAALQVDGDVLKTIQAESDLSRPEVRALQVYLDGVMKSQGRKTTSLAGWWFCLSRPQQVRRFFL